jgi:hypothetical protein
MYAALKWLSDWEKILRVFDACCVPLPGAVDRLCYMFRIQSLITPRGHAIGVWFKLFDIHS